MLKVRRWFRRFRRRIFAGRRLCFHHLECASLACVACEAYTRGYAEGFDHGRDGISPISAEKVRKLGRSMRFDEIERARSRRRHPRRH